MSYLIAIQTNDCMTATCRNRPVPKIPYAPFRPTFDIIFVFICKNRDIIDIEILRALMNGCACIWVWGGGGGRGPEVGPHAYSGHQN